MKSKPKLSTRYKVVHYPGNGWTRLINDQADVG